MYTFRESEKRSIGRRLRAACLISQKGPVLIRTNIPIQYLGTRLMLAWVSLGFEMQLHRSEHDLDGVGCGADAMR